jgi:hypothetical protein
MRMVSIRIVPFSPYYLSLISSNPTEIAAPFVLRATKRICSA